VLPVSCWLQYQLLKHEIDSARLTTDSGIDLVMYVPGTHEALTVQVKAIQGREAAEVGVGFPAQLQSGLACGGRSVTGHGVALAN
jgi:hypothetical protein